MGAFSFFDSHTKIRKYTHIYNFIKLTNVLIINNIVKLCNKYLSPKLTQNQSVRKFVRKFTAPSQLDLLEDRCKGNNKF